LTQYAGSKEVIKNVLYAGNMISVAAIGNCSQARGIQLASDTYFSNVVVSTNIVRARLLSPELPSQSLELAAIVAHGLPERVETAEPIYYYDNTAMSNYRLFNFGDSYGAGSQHYFVRTRLVREGALSDFRAIGVGYGTMSSVNNRILSTITEGDISLEDGRFVGSGQRNYAVGTNLDARLEECDGAPIRGVAFVVEDNVGVTLQGTSDSAGNAALHLLAYTMSGVEGAPRGRKSIHSGHQLRMTGYQPVSVREYLGRTTTALSPEIIRIPKTGERCL
jgi:hypothetical protein